MKANLLIDHLREQLNQAIDDEHAAHVKWCVAKLRKDVLKAALKKLKKPKRKG